MRHSLQFLYSKNDISIVNGSNIENNYFSYEFEIGIGMRYPLVVDMHAHSFDALLEIFIFKILQLKYLYYTNTYAHLHL